MNTSRKNHSARMRSRVLPSLRGALATKQSIFPLAAPWIASLTLAMTALGCLKFESEAAVEAKQDERS
jgi:hypothetical protein